MSRQAELGNDTGMRAERDELRQISDLLGQQKEEIAHLRHLLENVLSSQLAAMLHASSPHFRRNTLPNDSSATQRLLQSVWKTRSSDILGPEDLLESGFRVFSQGDEDGIILRVFQQIGTTNKIVVEIGSNCDNSDIGIPENLSSNLIVNHSWGGFIFELDETECRRMRHFFAQELSTKHFHSETYSDGYFSPRIIQGAVSPDSIQDIFCNIVQCNEPDLFVIDIDGGDFAIVENLQSFRPRVVVVEFEKRFRDKHSVVQRSRADFSKLFPQSGAASLPAWAKLMSSFGYVLVSIGMSGFNAFFVRSDIADGKLRAASAAEVFDSHPILARAESLWIEPDDSWELY